MKVRRNDLLVEVDGRLDQRQSLEEGDEIGLVDDSSFDDTGWQRQNVTQVNFRLGRSGISFGLGLAGAGRLLQIQLLHVDQNEERVAE